MKKTIDCKVYNTETATKIVCADNNFYPNDFRYCCETLYRTPKGAFFIVGEGGPLSCYSRQVGNMSSGGCDLVPYSDAEALSWLEEKGCQAEIDAHFAGLIEEA